MKAITRCVPPSPVYTVSCQYCKLQFEFHRCEARVFKFGNLARLKIRCPVCTAIVSCPAQP